jgi:hypothetical protein
MGLFAPDFRHGYCGQADHFMNQLNGKTLIVILLALAIGIWIGHIIGENRARIISLEGEVSGLRLQVTELKTSNIRREERWQWWKRVCGAVRGVLQSLITPKLSF